jgi:hypothetical protein
MMVIKPKIFTDEQRVKLVYLKSIGITIKQMKQTREYLHNTWQNDSLGSAIDMLYVCLNNRLIENWEI